MNFLLKCLHFEKINLNQILGLILSITGVVGQGAVFIPTLDRVGSITKINISDFGEDYMNKPEPFYYTWVTANDFTDRDPVSWEIKSKTDINFRRISAQDIIK